MKKYHFLGLVLLTDLLNNFIVRASSPPDIFPGGRILPGNQKAKVLPRNVKAKEVKGVVKNMDVYEMKDMTIKDKSKT